MFGSLGKFALKMSIKTYGPPRIYRDLYRINRQNISEQTVRKNINETIKFFLRDENVELSQIIENENIQYLVRKAKNDLEKNEILAKIVDRFN